MKAFRELKISLAAKCQLLFGVAVALIIAAALLTPWRRMEELTDELDRRGARTLIESVLARHVAEMATAGRTRATLPTLASPTTAPSVTAASKPAADDTAPTSPAASTSAPTIDEANDGGGGVEQRFGAGATTQGVKIGRESVFLPRLVGATSARLTPSEQRALRRFALNPDQDVRAFYYTRRGVTPAYRYTQAVYARGECLRCHTDQAEQALTVALPGDTAGKLDLLRLPPGLIGTVTVDLASQRETNQVLLNRVVFLAAGLLAGALAIVVFSLITSRFILQPVRVLQVTAEKVSQGDLDIRSHIGTGDEFEQLSRTINTMLTNLQSSEDRLRTANRTLDAKLVQLSETNIALAETNRLKSEFLANVSHELRTPLNSILGFAELLRKSAEQAQDGRATRYAQNIHASGTNLLTLINDLLDLAKVEAGRMEVRPQEFTLGELFESLVSVLKPLTEPKQVVVQIELESAPPPLPVRGLAEGGEASREDGPAEPPEREPRRPREMGVPILTQDVSKVQQILYNFLSNAIKYSPPEGTIVLRAVMEDDEHVRISVTDDGPGIEPDKQRAIFEKFRQLDASVTRTHGGTGLGLAISKELTALLGGRIGVESSVGEGATFFVILPVRIEAGAAEVRRAVTFN